MAGDKYKPVREETNSDVRYSRSKCGSIVKTPLVLGSTGTEKPAKHLHSLPNSAQSLQNPTNNLHSPTYPFKLEPDLISLLNAQIAAISLQITRTTDLAKLEELIKAERLLRRYRKNELSARRLRLRHLRDWHKRSPRKRKSEGEPNAKQTEAAKLFEFLQQVAEAAAKGLENPTRNAALQMDPLQPAQPPRPPVPQPPHFGDAGFSVQPETLPVRRKPP